MPFWVSPNFIFRVTKLGYYMLIVVVFGASPQLNPIDTGCEVSQ